jgi:hypothetical protein
MTDGYNLSLSHSTVPKKALRLRCALAFGREEASLLLCYPALIPQRARASETVPGYFHSSRLRGTRFLGGSPVIFACLAGHP